MSQNVRTKIRVVFKTLEECLADVKTGIEKDQFEGKVREEEIRRVYHNIRNQFGEYPRNVQKPQTHQFKLKGVTNLVWYWLYEQDGRTLRPVDSRYFKRV